MLPGTYLAVKKSGKVYYRASITYRGKHISLGSFGTEEDASQAYVLASKALADPGTWQIERYPHPCILQFHKWVVLINFRDNSIYFKTPIYLKKQYFLYYIDPDTCLKFSIDDLFYYSRHKILKRGGHLFVTEYGMQVNILSRYGIKSYAVADRDYCFANGDPTDFTYDNIRIINRYYGVTKEIRNGKPLFTAKVHINGNHLIGRYPSEVEAAIAYNKATLLLKNKGLQKEFLQNYIEGMDAITYASAFQKIRISKSLLTYAETL
ncbi:MAG: hypothetical protein E7255_15560 [Lachnospiraceae bacterium]|jgi:hypothetical protein|nr:hypothetical protein [Lachnospiraceae bacterium]